MTQIVTVSAATAAYATEGLKAGARVSGSANTPETAQLQSQESRAADRKRHVQMAAEVGAAGVAAFFMAAGERKRYLPQTTLHHAQDAYLSGENPDRIDDQTGRYRRRKDDRKDGHNGAEQDQADGRGDQAPPATVLALPAPDEFA